MNRKPQKSLMDRREKIERKNSMLLNQLDLSSCSVIGELPVYDAVVLSHELIRNVTSRLDSNPDLPGVIVLEKDGPLILSRQRLHEWLSRPFGTELFLNRPITYLISTTTLPGLILSANTRIDESVRFVLNRPITEMQEPIIVQQEEGKLNILDFHVLLLAQTQLLAQANHSITQQLESGKVLSQIMDLHDVLSQILRHLAGLMDFDQGMILIVDPTMQGYSAQSLQVRVQKKNTSISHDVIYDMKASNYLYHSHQPLLITSVENAEEWLNPRDFPTIQSWIGFPLIYSDKVICLISLTRLIGKDAPSTFTRSDLDLIASLSSTFTSAIRNAHLHTELRILAVTDPLTSVLNRRGFFDSAQKINDRQVSLNNPNAVLILDIDFFKRINDTYGHRVGDLVIRSIANECRSQLRDVDLLGRYGGEEFIALLPDTNLNGAKIVAERLRDSIAHLAIQTGSGSTQVTVSIGLSVMTNGSQSLETIVQHADEAMYQAKSLGRNRIEVWENQVGSKHENPAKMWQFDQHLEAIRANFSGINVLDDELPRMLPSRPVEEIETESILGWMRALELRENGEEHHGQSAADLTIRLCRRVGFVEADLVHIYRGAILHDVGKLAIPDTIHNKPGPLDEAEWKIMRTHVEKGYQILMPINFLRPALAIPYCHHEKWDGTGYPRQLKELEIPLEARLFALVDVWQALKTDRCYRPAWPEEKIVEYIRSQSGNHFDPDLVELFLDTVSN